MQTHDLRVSVKHETIRIEELHVHLGDILPAGTNYQDADGVLLKFTLHYSDPYGRPRSKSITLPNTTIL